jgi:hypothetical protein
MSKSYCELKKENRNLRASCDFLCEKLNEREQNVSDLRQQLSDLQEVIAAQAVYIANSL